MVQDQVLGKELLQLEHQLVAHAPSTGPARHDEVEKALDRALRVLLPERMVLSLHELCAAFAV